MEADSTTANYNQFFRNPESAETLSTPEDILNICAICKCKDTEINVDIKRLEAENNKCHIFFAESKIFLLCQSCFHFCHLHCHANGKLTIDLMIEYIERDTYMCDTCRDNQNE